MSSLIGVEPVLVARSLAEAGTELGRLGGKAVNLARLAVAGFPVPEGFVITTAAYRQHVAGLSLADEDPVELRRRIEAAPVAARLAELIMSAYRGLPAGPVAVRSSATAEDLPGAAFAGQQDTYLNVTEPDLLGAVRRCWASLWTDRAVAYRRRLRIDPEEVSIAVVVQAMVPAEVAGVMFTADPVSGRRDVIMIDAAAGLGEALVSGEVTPDHHLLDAEGRQLEFRAGVPSTGQPLLAADQLRRLAELGAAVRDHFGGPQDIEWALADGRFRLLQARPMTALPTPAAIGAGQRLASSVVSDYLVQRPYPLDVTTWLPYGPAGIMMRLVSRIGLRVDLATLLPEEDGVVTRLQPVSPKPSPRLLVALPAMLFRAHRFDPARWRSDPRVGQFERRLADLSGDPAELGWRDLIRRPRDLFRVAELSGSVREDFLPGIAVSAVRLRLRLTLLRETRLLDDLIGGAVTATTIMNERLAEIAAAVRRAPDAARLFADLPTDALLVRLREDPALAELAADFDRLLADFGHRETASPVLVSPPTWIDQPEAPLGTIKALAAGAEPPTPADRAAAAEAIVFGKRSLADPRRRAAMRAAIDAARAGTVFREDSHDLLTRPAPVLRRCLLEIGRRLRAAGVLAEPFDVFHLRLEELEAIIDPERLEPAERDRLTRLVRRRAIAREELAAVPMINRVAVFGPAGDTGDAIVTGTPAGAGVATGPARVITDATEFGTLRPGEVLVCPYTNPAWTPLFQSAVAVVADTGGVGSHAAIVAREYGLPAIMGTGEGTVRLRTGDRIRVDGTTGRVTAADGSAAGE
ncbi:PEP/pyruvate-binding domain-containing protein [Microlunatus speluncae]|uniref:PEP/pyruvate-binding domain-containing protein n=1 Tax=Microlunatus speluncae TaxID=2594267 RepID=UPI00126606C9|nr:PEP/pyruvate-binding domain-containing protein [Microlunatus speluncae]